MTRQAGQPRPDNDGAQLTSAQLAQSYPEEFVISPAVGGLPSIYVPPSPTTAPASAGV